MAAIKAYTDLSQSKTLSKVLPLESADMYYAYGTKTPDIMIGSKQDYRCYTMCWSLAALLNVLPKIYYPIKDHETNLILGKPKDKYCVLYWDVTGMQHGEQTLADNPVDACYELILKLNELKML